MDINKKQIVKELWRQFKQKIIQEWGEKYKKFGDLSDFRQVRDRFNFAKEVQKDIGRYMKQNEHLKSVEIISVSTLNQIFQKGTLPEESKFKTLDMCAYFVGSEGWDDFKSHYSQIITDADSENFEEQVNFDKAFSPDEEQYFIYHYTDTSFRPDKALLILTNRKARLTTFTRDDEQGLKRPQVEYEGEIIYSKNNEITIHFIHERWHGIDHITSNPSFCCFENIAGNQRIGVFASAGQTISCGLVVIEKTSKDEYLRKINSDKVPPHIHSIIYNQRLVANGYQHKDDFLAKKAKVIDTIKKYAGVYEGFTIINKGGLAIQRFALEIFENGNVEFKSEGKSDGERGRVVDVRKDKNMVMLFNLNRTHNYFKVQIVLDLKNDRLRKEKGVRLNPLIGIFGGIEEISESPMAGRLILYPTEKKYQEIEVEIIHLDDEQKIQQLFDRRKRRGLDLRKFFRGEVEEYVDPPYIIERCPYLSAEDSISPD